MIRMGNTVMTKEVEDKQKFITIKILRSQVNEIEKILKTSKGKKYVNQTDFIRQAINEKIEKL